MAQEPAGTPAGKGDPGEDSGEDSGQGLDRLPERLRRWQRFGGAQAAALAEAEALRREIDALAARLARAEAGRRGSASGSSPQASGGWEELRRSDTGADEFPVSASQSRHAWLALRRAGLAVSDAIARLAAPANAATE